MIKDGPLKSAIEADKEGILIQKYTVYVKMEGSLIKETITRKHRQGTYHDTTYREVMFRCND